VGLIAQEFYKYRGFRLIGTPVNWGSRLFGANPGQQKQIENITGICFVYLGQILDNKNKSRIYPEFTSLIWGTMPFNWASNCHMASL
jgi:hypothetical protein